MEKKIENVELLVQNMPGVLDRVVIHMRPEGWNIKRLFVDETEDAGVSRMEISIEGTHTKLAGVMAASIFFAAHKSPRRRGFIIC